MAQGVDGVPLESEAYVGAGAGGDADAGVAEELFDDDEVDRIAILDHRHFRAIKLHHMSALALL
ncbi:hypothetical protein ACFUN7_17310 [Streptomyces sp. NPDC057236]|uniref:hypothetical protein n=1 Tax=Streptomyces sp. NPDC057236 TaxID=3346059 RepID=UPI0036459BDF